MTLRYMRILFLFMVVPAFAAAGCDSAADGTKAPEESGKADSIESPPNGEGTSSEEEASSEEEGNSEEGNSEEGNSEEGNSEEGNSEEGNSEEGPSGLPGDGEISQCYIDANTCIDAAATDAERQVCADALRVCFAGSNPSEQLLCAADLVACRLLTETESELDECSSVASECAAGASW